MFFIQDFIKMIFIGIVLEKILMHSYLKSTGIFFFQNKMRAMDSEKLIRWIQLSNQADWWVIKQ